MAEFLTQISGLLTIVAIFAMAASAAIQGVRHGFDPFGSTVLALAAALGGGTVRDLLLGRTPVFWMTDLTHLATAIPVALAAYFWARNLNAGGGRRLRILMYFDAIGLALFTLTGVNVAIDAGASMPIAVIMGCITGTFGGMFRDMLCNVTPSILKQDLYATISLLGGALYLTLDANLANDTVVIWASFAAMFVARAVVIARAAT